ncbi:MAG: gliding motility-associated C-terminal domain-containing protein [Cyclobacteriaceae bacterium]
MKKILILLSLSVAWISAKSFHIVGGEIEFITIRPGLYQVNLIQYRDEAQDQNNSIQPNVTLRLFSNKDDQPVGSDFVLDFVENTPVFYTNIACTIEELETSRVIWSAQFELDPRDYSDIEGYYITWDRCCRNEDVINIIGSGSAGMQYILEIPPLYKNGSPFVNSSPILNKPLSDYACVGQFFYTSFIGRDLDGDSLSYRLATPLNSKGANSTSAIPPFGPESKPTLPLRWADGFDLENAIPGNPSLGISSKGLLTVTPSQPGLFVFSVIVEEWRFDEDSAKDIQIGEVQRDFQMLVIDGCGALPPPPVLDVVIPDNAEFDSEVDTLKFGVEDDKCFEFLVTGIEQGESISFRADPVNFEGEFDVLGGINYIVGPGDQLFVQYCAPECPPVRGRPFVVDFIVQDDVCPLPQLDTVRMSIQVEPPPNFFVNLSPILGDPFNVSNGNEITLNFVATDADNDSVDVSLLFDDVKGLDERGMTFELTKDEAGRAEGFFNWKVDCNDFDLSDKQSFRIGILAEDEDQCQLENPAIEWVDLNALLPGNTDPIVTSSSSNIISRVADEKVDFEIFADDEDNDFLNLRIAGDGFNPDEFGVEFEEASGFGSVSGAFSWTPFCDSLNLLAKNQFRFFFIAGDINDCNIQNPDTLIVEIDVALRENARPEFDEMERTYQVLVNEPFELPISSSDLDPDNEIRMQFHESFRRPVSASLEFESVSGFENVTSTLKWTPECRLLPPGSKSEFYDLIFLVFDDNCPISGLDTMKLTFEVLETREAFVSFDPPNVFTPNGDTWNNVFTLTDHLDTKRNLPPDNCEDSFDYIVIQDRTGNNVFESADRNFRWTGDGHEAGTYFYFIRYTETEYKGVVTILR